LLNVAIFGAVGVIPRFVCSEEEEARGHILQTGVKQLSCVTYASIISNSGLQPCYFPSPEAILWN